MRVTMCAASNSSGVGVHICAAGVVKALSMKLSGTPSAAMTPRSTLISGVNSCARMPGKLGRWKPMRAPSRITRSAPPKNATAQALKQFCAV